MFNVFGEAEKEARGAFDALENEVFFFCITLKPRVE